MMLIKIIAGSVIGSTISQRSVIETTAQWESKPAHELIFNSSPREIDQYMYAVDKILQSPGMNGFEEHFTKSMDRLKLEFQAVLSQQSHYAAGPSSLTDFSSLTDSTASAIRYEDYLVFEKKPNEKVIGYLRKIAERVSNGGKLQDCVRTYISERKPFLESRLKKLGFQELNVGGRGRNLASNNLLVKIELWIQVSKICVNIFFKSERTFCEDIFQKLGGATAAKDACFVGTVQDFAVRLFGFVESVSLSKQPYDKMVSVFGLYDVFLSVVEVSETLFASESGKSIRSVYLETLPKVENDVERMMHDFEKAVLNEISNVPDGQGEVHRSTEYVMDTVNLLVSKKLLTSLIKTAPVLKFGDVVIPREEFGDFCFRTFLDRHSVLIIVVLLMNLEEKFKKYDDPILGHLFMMNNICYIVRKIEGSDELPQIIGDIYLNKLRHRVEQSRLHYQTSTSNKFLACFEEEGLYSATWFFRQGLSRTTLKKRMKDFNQVFEDVRASHSSWMVPDSQLRDKIRLSMSEMLVPAYEQFLAKFKRRRCGSIRHPAEEFKALVLEKLFANSS